MKVGLLVCVPGPWKDRSEFLRQVITLEPMGRYMFAGAILADVQEKDHIPLEFRAADPHVLTAFEIAGQGMLPQSILMQIQEHASVVYLHFPLDIRAQRERLITFSSLLERLGGFAVKIESTGIAHSWARWFELLNGSLFDLYCSSVVLVAGPEHYYSCGMHHFGLPDCAVPRSGDLREAAELMNQFNFWQIAEVPVVESGHTFSVSAESPRYRVLLNDDDRYEADHPFHNEWGRWFLSPV